MENKKRSKKRQWLLKGLMMGLLILLCACGQESSAPEIGSVSVGSGVADDYSYKSSSGIVPEGGYWVSAHMDFIVSEDSTLVESFEVNFSGRASNERCDFDYSDVITVNDLDIIDGNFVYDDGDIVVDGSFTATGDADVTVLWFGYYGGACEIHYNGEMTEVAELIPPTE